MSISQFANSGARHDGGWALHGVGTRARYRELKRIEAQERQAAFDAEVAKIAHEQNCEPETARDIARGRRRFERRLAARKAA